MSYEKIKKRIDRLKNKGKTIALATLLSSPLTANAAQNNSTNSDYHFEGKTEVVTKHLNKKYSQTTSFHSRETHKDNSEKNYTSALQTLYELGDGYFMTSSQVSQQTTKNNKKSFFDNDVLYLSCPDGSVFDCSFLHQKGGPDFLPMGFEKDCFVKENGQPDTDLENKAINEVTEVTGADKITPEATIKYNNIMKQKLLNQAKENGIPDNAINKIDVYLQQNLEFLHTGKNYIESGSNLIIQKSRLSMMQSGGR